jgi:hypothetical protein
LIVCSLRARNAPLAPAKTGTSNLARPAAPRRYVSGAYDGIRTRDLVFTKDVLYRLSYVGASRGSQPARRRSMLESELLERRRGNYFVVGRAGFEPAKA